MSDSNSQTFIISSVALLISALSFAISLFAFRRDVAKLRLTYMEKSNIIHARHPYKPDTLYTSVTATNIGRRKCTITHMGHKNLWEFKTDQVWGESLSKNPVTLSEGDFVVYLAEYENVVQPDWYKLAYFFVVDTAGRTTRKRIANLFVYVPFVMLYWLYCHRPFKRMPASK